MLSSSRWQFKEAPETAGHISSSARINEGSGSARRLITIALLDGMGLFTMNGGKNKPVGYRIPIAGRQNIAASTDVF